MDGVEQLVDIPLQDRLEAVQRDPRTMVGQPRLREVVGPDLLAALTAAHLAATLIRALPRLPLALVFE